MLQLDELTARFGPNAHARHDHHGTPVLSPDSEELAREIVHWCGRERVPFLPGRGGEPVKRASVPLRVSTDKLWRVLDWDEGNATVEAQAGVDLGELNEMVGERGQFVPLDWAHLDDEWSTYTLGQALASNKSGPSKLKWGAPRDLAVGLRAVLSDGREVRAGAKVVKNVAGYDLTKLFVGSRGSLGLITRGTIRLRPRDAAAYVWQSAPLSYEEARARCEELLSGAFEPTWVVVLVGRDGWSVRACIQGGEASVAAQCARLPESAVELRGTMPPSFSSGTYSGFMNFRAQLPLALAPEFAQRAQGFGVSVEWDAGNGVVYGVDNLSVYGEKRQLFLDLRREVEAVGGRLRIGSYFFDLSDEEVWGAPPPGVDLMRALKAKFDAANVCAPGALGFL